MGVAKRTVLLSILGGATVSTTLSNMGPARKEGTTHSHPAKVVEARSLQGTVGTISRIAPPRALPTNRQPANLSVIPYPHLPYATPLYHTRAHITYLYILPVPARRLLPPSPKFLATKLLDSTTSPDSPNALLELDVCNADRRAYATDAHRRSNDQQIMLFFVRATP